MEHPPQLPQSKHFTLDPLGDGIYAAIHKDGGWAIGNAGIIDLGDTTLIFDSLMTPAAAEDLRQAAESLTGRPAAIVINSHYHNDHIWGNQVFLPGAKLISTTETHQLILSGGKEEYNWYSENSPGELAKFEIELASDSDPDRRQHLNFWLSYYQALTETMPILEVCYPTITFQERMVISGSERQAEVRTFGGGHTGSDAFLFLPGERIGFLGDLLFVETHPFLADGDPDALQIILQQIRELGLDTLVPGHGATGGPTWKRIKSMFVLSKNWSTKYLETIRAKQLWRQLSSQLVFRAGD